MLSYIEMSQTILNFNVVTVYKMILRKSISTALTLGTSDSQFLNGQPQHGRGVYDIALFIHQIVTSINYVLKVIY